MADAGPDQPTNGPGRSLGGDSGGTITVPIRNTWTNATIYEAVLDAKLEEQMGFDRFAAAVRQAVAMEVDLARAHLVRAELAGASLCRAELASANLAGAVLTGAQLRRAHLFRAELPRAILFRADIEEATLTGADLTRADLGRANLRDTSLRDAKLVRADLEGAILATADLTDADLTDAKLARADLAGADLTGANLTGAALAGAVLTAAKFGGAKWADGVILTKAPVQIYGLGEPVHILDTHMQIGCEMHSHQDWANLDDSRILRMGGKSALRAWRVHKAALLALCAAHAPENVPPKAAAPAGASRQRPKTDIGQGKLAI